MADMDIKMIMEGLRSDYLGKFVALSDWFAQRSGVGVSAG